MNVDARMNLNMSQRLVMTPMLQQAIKLLQMSRMELVDLVKQEMLENPVLDEIEENSDQLLDQQEPSASEIATADSDVSLQEGQNETDGTGGQSDFQEIGINWEEYFNDNPGGLGYYGEYDPDEGSQMFDNVLGQAQSLSEHLYWQLQMSQLPERSMRIGKFLIGQIDEDGYLRCEEPTVTPLPNIHATDLQAEQLQEYRTAVIHALCQKINAEFEREYLASTIRIHGIQGILAHVVTQEYYEEFTHGKYQEIVDKLHQFTLEDLSGIIKFLGEIPAQKILPDTDISKAEIESGLESIKRIGTDLRQLIEAHLHVLLQDTYETKLERIGGSAEELHLIEYFLSQLSAEEIAYVASKEDFAKSVKHENAIQNYLEKLQQSYAHIDNLTSPKYFLIQLYMAGTGIIVAEFKAKKSPLRFQKLFLKLSHLTRDDVANTAKYLWSQIEQFYQDQRQVMDGEVERILRHLQTFTPSGVGARDLKECLTIQARNLGITDTAIEVIINDHLQELKHYQYDRMLEHLDMSLEEVELAKSIISNMSPKPGADFTNERPEYIVPDIYVYKVDGEYEVVLNEDELPNLRINPTYKKIMTGNDHAIPNATKQYVDQKLRSAIWFIRSIEQRKRTVYKVGKSIVNFQKDFLEYGVSQLKPLVLRDVAEDIAMHESTVSRVTTNKYIHTPQGVFELKYFFHSGLESSSGDDVSSIAIKEQIKQIIEDEDPDRPLSDKTIETMLNNSGVAIARRTVAKYREELGILSSIQRKRKKRVMGNEQ